MNEDEFKRECRELMWAYLREVVEEQIETGVPAATGETFRRLIREGHTPSAAKEWIGGIVLREILMLNRSRNPGEPPMKLKKYDEEFVERLNLLPDCPFVMED